MVNVIGNTLYSSNGSITAHGLKATSQICRCPLPNIDKSLPIFARQTLEIIKQAGSSEAKMSQTALKTLATMMRECSALNMKEKDLTFLLELVTPDLREPARQSNAFAILKAIIARKFVAVEIYDMMDKVAEIMVTSQSTQVQELCRGVLLQFLLDYPQGKGRLKQHFAFLVKNLSYIFEAGRMSVMELLNATILKFSDAIIEEYADMIFIGLVMVIANDDSSKCRETSAQLLKSLIKRLKEEQCKTVLSHVHVWASQEGNVALARVSSQLYSLVLDTLKVEGLPYVDTILGDVNKKVNDAVQRMDQGDEEEAHSSSESVNAQWQVTVPGAARPLQDSVDLSRPIREAREHTLGVCEQASPIPSTPGSEQRRVACLEAYSPSHLLHPRVKLFRKTSLYRCMACRKSHGPLLPN